MPNGTYGGVRGRKTKVGRELLRFPPTRLLSKMGARGLFATFVPPPAHRQKYYRRWGQGGFLLLLCRLLLTVKSSGRQTCHPFLSLHPLLHTFKGALGNGACVLVPKVITVYGYSHAPQVTDVAGHIISRGQVNELHPCVLAVCQYEIVFHFACFFYGYK